MLRRAKDKKGEGLELGAPTGEEEEQKNGGRDSEEESRGWCSLTQFTPARQGACGCGYVLSG